MTSDQDIAAAAERIAVRARLDVFRSSQEAGCDMASQALEGGVDHDALLQAADGVARYCDEAIAIVSEAYRPPLACQEGCSFCCRKPGVLASLPELIRIVAHVRATDAAGVAARAREYVSLVGAGDVHTPTSASVPCPLLVDSRCSVYELRPMVCRGYNSTSVDACQEAHADPMVGVPIFAMLRDVTDGATVGAAAALADAGVDATVFDLGTALHLMLGTTGENAADHDLLAAARHPTWVRELMARVQDAGGR